MIAAVAEVGNPSESSGASVPGADALLAASGPPEASIAAWPNSSGCLVRRFSIRYDRKVGISLPPAGRAPLGKPSTVPRNQGFHERFQSSRLIHLEPLSAKISSFSKR